MYTTPPAQEERRDVLVRAAREIQFAAIVVAPAGLFASSHLPLLVREETDGSLILEGHVSRSNPLWRLGDGATALAIFQGPHAYIRPGWRPRKQHDGRVVPTWNYIAVHLTGDMQAIEDGDWLRRHLEALTLRNEAERAQPWSISDAPPDYIAALTRGIVGLQIRVQTLEGSWKLDQSQPLEARRGAIAGLEESSRPEDLSLAAAMSDVLAGSDS